MGGGATGGSAGGGGGSAGGVGGGATGGSAGGGAFIGPTDAGIIVTGTELGSAQNGAEQPSVAFVGSTPHIAYVDLNTKALRHAWRVGSAWQTELVDGAVRPRTTAPSGPLGFNSDDAIIMEAPTLVATPAGRRVQASAVVQSRLTRGGTSWSGGGMLVQ
jgi:hypothetical protein